MIVIRTLLIVLISLSCIGASVHKPQAIPLEGLCVDSAGDPVELRDLFKKRPALLMLGYLKCEHLCNWTLDTACRTLSEMKGEVGEDFSVVFLSVDPEESLHALSSERRRLSNRYGRGSESGWHFLRTSESEVRRLALQLGYRYERTDDGQIAHPAAYFVVEPGGRPAQAFYGIELPAGKLSAAVAAARQGREQTWSEAFLMLCQRYNPISGPYGAMIDGALRWGGLATVVLLGGGILVMVRRERKEGK